MNIPVEQHYSREYLLEDILASLERSGIDKNKLTRKDLSRIDEFHVRGAEVTMELAAQAGLQKDMKILDVGCGIGGPTRLLADEYGCNVTGIDITREYIRIATELSALTGLADRTHFLYASALQLPFASNSFDRVWTQHVQMNIGDKKQFYAEISRVLKPGGLFIYYDIFSTGDHEIYFPVPWADNASLSHLITPDQLHNLLSDNGLQAGTTINQTASGILFLERLFEKMKEQGSPPVGLPLLIGISFKEKFQNLHRNLVEKKLMLESGICTKS